MGCNNCATNEGLPKGCKSNGNCLTGGCNKLNTFDWLAEVPIAFESNEIKYHEVSFKKGSRKGFYKNDKRIQVETGDMVMVDAAIGYDIGEITLSGELVKLQMKKKKVKNRSDDIRSIVGIPDDKQLELLNELRSKEKEMLVKARVIARRNKLNMKIGDIEFQADKKKATFYYTAEERVDFRELVKEYAHEFKLKVEMRQIGARQESGRIGGIGDCGRELCCSTWLTDFKTVSTSAARYQNLSINMEKLSGQCGRLKCCLNYELDTYIEAGGEFPKKADSIETQNGRAYLQKTDILKRLMWYTYKDSPRFYPIEVDKVKEILELNKEGKKPADLSGFMAYKEVEEKKEEEVDLVGHISLDVLEKTSRKRRGNQQGNRRKGNNKNQPKNQNQNRNKNRNRNRNQNKNNPNRGKK